MKRVTSSLLLAILLPILGARCTSAPAKAGQPDPLAATDVAGPTLLAEAACSCTGPTGNIGDSCCFNGTRKHCGNDTGNTCSWAPTTDKCTSDDKPC